jgi:hypothetical protein
MNVNKECLCATPTKAMFGSYYCRNCGAVRRVVPEAPAAPAAPALDEAPTFDALAHLGDG